MAMIGSMKQKMVIYPISEPDADGNQVINWVANVREPEGANITVRDWNRKVEKGPLLKLYKDWKFDWIDVPEMIEKTDGGIFEFPMSDRNPLDKWSFSRVTLIGDAAHPMYPIGSNGASQAILDADALALALLAEKDVDFTESKLKDLEIFILVRLLFNLGYLASSASTELIINLVNFDWLEITRATEKRLELINIINSSFLSSGL